MGEVFSCGNLAHGAVVLDCGATDTVATVEVVEAITGEGQEIFGADPDLETVDTNDRFVNNQEDTKWHICRRCTRHLHAYPVVPVSLSVRSLQTRSEQ